MADALAANVTELLAEREAALADLYRTYAWRFSDHRTLWNDLRADELIHAGWARSLAGPGGAAPETDGPGLVESLACVRDAIVRVRNGRVTECEALGAAFGFEKSMLAEGSLECADADPVARATLRAMRSSTVEHLERVRAAYESAARVAS
ncbi:MAG: hypothetical protein ACYTKD_04680 [Planctomycetota bacterium]|jgi:hypothetical protein